jgi:hypothetical protein
MNKLILPFAALLLGFSSASNAVSTTRYDFAAEGNFNSREGEKGYASFNTGTNSFSGMPGGLTITASDGSGAISLAKDSNGDDILGPQDSDFAYEAYIDGNTGDDSRNAGLGVCHIANGCWGNSDDNHMQGEYIHMEFDSVLEILSLDITGDHEQVHADAKLLYSLDGGMIWLEQAIGGLQTDGDLIDNLAVNWFLSNKTLDYTITPETGQMYLSAMTVSPVPVPAAFWLFGTALIGFVGLSRRTNLS